jgi:MFS family permease
MRGHVTRAEADPRLFTAPFVLVCLATYCYFLAHQLCLLAMPLYALYRGGSEADAGTLTLLFTTSALFARLPVGWVMDRWGRRPILVGGSLLAAASAILYPEAVSLAAIFALRILHGFSLGVHTTAAAAVVTDVVPPARRGEGMGYFGWGSNVALALGPLLALAIVSRYSFRPLFLLAAGIVSIGAIMGAAISETRAKAVDPPSLSLANIFVRSAILPAIFMGALTVCHGALVTFLPLLGRARAVGNPGTFFTVAAIVLVAVRAKAGVLSDRWGRGPIIVPGMFLAALGIIVVGLAFRPVTLLAAGVLYGFGFGLAAPALMALVGDRTRPEDRGRAMATFYSGWEIGIGVGAFPLGFLLSWTSFTVMYAAAGLVTASGGLGFLLWSGRASRHRGHSAA